MKISALTLSILKNFAGVNPSIVVHKGSKLQTIAQVRNVLAYADVAETFPRDFAIYDLSEFLSAISLLSTPEFEFGETAVVVSSGGTKIRYYYGDPSGIITPPTKQLKFADPEINVVITKDMMDAVLKAASVLQVPDLALESDGTVIVLRVLDKKNPSGNTYQTEVSKDEVGTPFVMFFKVENLKMLPGDYDVAVSAKKISRFASKDGALLYYVALEPDSNYGSNKWTVNEKKEPTPENESESGEEDSGDEE